VVSLLCGLACMDSIVRTVLKDNEMDIIVEISESLNNLDKKIDKLIDEINLLRIEKTNLIEERDNWRKEAIKWENIAKDYHPTLQ